MPDSPQTTIRWPLPFADLTDYLRRAFSVLDAMAAAGIAVEGEEEPGALLCAFTESVGTEYVDQALALLDEHLPSPEDGAYRAGFDAAVRIAAAKADAVVERATKELDLPNHFHPIPWQATRATARDLAVAIRAMEPAT